MGHGFLLQAAAVSEKVTKSLESLERWMRTPELGLRLNDELGLGQMKVSVLYFSPCYQVSMLGSHRVHPSVLCCTVSLNVLSASRGPRGWEVQLGGNQQDF